MIQEWATMMPSSWAAQDGQKKIADSTVHRIARDADEKFGFMCLRKEIFDRYAKQHAECRLSVGQRIVDPIERITGTTGYTILVGYIFEH